MNWTRIIACALTLLISLGVYAAQEEDVDYLELAALMLRDGNVDRALIALDQIDVTEEELDLQRYYTLRGMAHLRQNQYEASAEAFEQAAAMPDASSTIFVYLAQNYYQLGQYQDVIGALDRAGPELQRVASIYHMRAQCHWLLENHAMALATLDQATMVFPEDAGFMRRKVFFLIELGLYREASELGQVYLQRSQGARDDFVALGNAMRASGELEAAKRLLEEAKLRFPGDTDINKVLAHTYIEEGQLNSAADLVLEGAMINPDLIGEAAELYRRAGQPQRALMLNGQVIDQETKLKQRLALLIELQQFETAAGMENALLRNGLLDDEDIRYALAYSIFKVGDFPRAELHLQKLTRPDLFRKAAELRRAIQDCSQDTWQCI